MNQSKFLYLAVRIIVGMMSFHLAHSVFVLAHSCNSPAGHHRRCTEYSPMQPNTVYITRRSLLLSLTSHSQPSETKMEMLYKLNVFTVESLYLRYFLNCRKRA